MHVMHSCIMSVDLLSEYAENTVNFHQILSKNNSDQGECGSSRHGVATQRPMHRGGDFSPGRPRSHVGQNPLFLTSESGSSI
jgi:hypothetical protein